MIAISGRFRRTSRTSRRRGFTLVEMMVALVAGLIVSAAALAFFFASMKSNGEYVQSTRLTQELRNTLELMTRDLRRAGYDDDGLKYVGNVNTSPFTPMCVTANGTDSSVLSNCVTTGNSGGTSSCVIYGYDRTNPNGSSSTSGAPGTLDISNGEARGMRRVTATINGVSGVGIIEYAVSSGTTKPNCNDATATYSTFPPTCNGVWCPLSDPTRIDVTALTITNNSQTLGSNPSAQIIRQFLIQITGRLTGTTDFTRSEQATLKVRSDCMRAAIVNCSASP